MYSLRMSFWVVPLIRPALDALALGGGHVQGQQDRRRGVDGHRGRDLAERQPVEQDRHVGERRDRDPDPADLALGGRRVGVVAHLGRQVEGHRQAGLALVQEVAEPLVGLLGGREAGVLAHRPEPAAVHRRLDAAGERVLAGAPEVAVLVEAGRVGRGIEVADLDARRRLEPLPALGGGGRRLGLERRAPPVPTRVGGLAGRAARSVDGGWWAGHPRTTRTSPRSTVEPGADRDPR